MVGCSQCVEGEMGMMADGMCAQQRKHAQCFLPLTRAIVHACTGADDAEGKAEEG